MNRPAARWAVAVLGAAACTIAFGVSGLEAGDGKKKDEKKGPHLRYAASYAEAWAEAKARHTLIYATWHKDN
jgi:hypothetical protein